MCNNIKTGAVAGIAQRQQDYALQKVQIDAAEVIINGSTTANGNFTTKGGIVNLN